MSRYTGPAWKVSRRLGFSTLETGKELAKRPYGPGQHGENKRKKNSEYGKQLIEKQKLRMMYGVSERQFQRLFKIAKADKNAVTGTKFMQILESRLDNLVYRFGFAKTRRAARQLVNHGHITVNGAKVDIPSYICSVGDVIKKKKNSKELKVVKEALESLLIVAPYLELDKEKMVGKYTRIPERNELNKEITESQIVEFYNRKL